MPNGPCMRAGSTGRLFAAAAARWLGALGLLLATGGCLNPNLVNSAVGGVFASAPGDLPLLHIRIVNQSRATIDEVFLAVEQDGVTSGATFVNISPRGGEIGSVWQCPTSRIGLGQSLDTQGGVSLVAAFPEGATVNVRSTLPALQEGIDYLCGDTVIFFVTDSASATSGIAISAGRIDGTAESTDVLRGNTFATIQGLILLNGF